MKLKTVYLLLAIIGAVVPYAFFFDFWSADGLSLIHFVAAWFANGSVGGMATDLLLSSLVFWVFICSRYRKGRAPHPLLFVLLNIFIGLSCALPAYLWATTK